MTSPLVFDIAAFRGKVTLSTVAAWVDDHAQLTCKNGLVLVIVVFNVSDALVQGCSRDFSGVHSRLQPLEVIDVILNSSGSIVCDFCHWLGGVLYLGE